MKHSQSWKRSRTTWLAQRLTSKVPILGTPSLHSIVKKTVWRKEVDRGMNRSVLSIARPCQPLERRYPSGSSRQSSQSGTVNPMDIEHNVCPELCLTSTTILRMHKDALFVNCQIRLFAVLLCSRIRHRLLAGERKWTLRYIGRAWTQCFSEKLIAFVCFLYA